MISQTDLFSSSVTAPLIVCWGAGQDSTGALVGLWERHIHPDLIIFSDVGSEREETYTFIPAMRLWLKSVGFPDPVIVRYQPKDYKHWPPYHTLEENVLTNVSLPSIAYGGHTCSAKWKIETMNRYINTWQPAIQAWANGVKCRKAIGFDDTPYERRRSAKGCATFATQADEKDKYSLEFPLQEWHWTRDHCVAAIKRVGLPVPPKSSCYFCTAMKPHEVDELSTDKLKRIVILEARTRLRHLDYAKRKGWPRGVSVPLTEGLWRKRVKGMRGATPKPGSITEYIREKGLLPTAEIDRIIAATPTDPLTNADFQRLGFNNWQDWIKSITE